MPSLVHGPVRRQGPKAEEIGPSQRLIPSHGLARRQGRKIGPDRTFEPVQPEGTVIQAVCAQTDFQVRLGQAQGFQPLHRFQAVVGILELKQGGEKEPPSTFRRIIGLSA
jgi:hypothetical protein